MLLIKCPYCGERPEIEFSYGGQAHLARPATIRISDQDWASTLHAPQSQGRACRALAHLQGCARFFMRCVTPPPIRSCTIVASAAQLGAAGLPPIGAMNRFRTQTGGLIDRTQSVRFGSTASRSRLCGDTLASALLANGIHLTGRSFKYHRPADTQRWRR